jgi:tellurite resistance protein
LVLPGARSARLPAVAGLAEAFLGAVILLFAFAAVAWASKPLRRPAVLAEELRVLPGRAGVAAAVLCVFLTAAVLVPYAPGVALAMVWAGIALLAGLGALIAHAFLTGPEEARVVTPVFHLVFVGYIIAPLALIPLGQGGVSAAIFWLTLAVAALIWAESLRQFATRIPPAPLRPLLAIHLAPLSLFATVAALLGWSGLALAFALAGLALLAVLLASGALAARGRLLAALGGDDLSVWRRSPRRCCGRFPIRWGCGSARRWFWRRRGSTSRSPSRF